MKPIPIYDATAPIACRIGEAEIAGRVELLQRLREHHIDSRRTEHGMELTFPNRTDIDVDVRIFAVEEKRCCAFWGFDVTSDADTVTLRWDGPPDAAELVDRLHAYFGGDGDLDTALAALL